MVAASVSARDGFAVYVSLDDGPAKEVARSPEYIGVAGDAGGFNRAGLSADGTLLALGHSEHGDLMHPAIRVIDPRTGGVVAEQLDEGKSLFATAWSPVAGDQRLAVTHERRGEDAPAVWDVGAGTWSDLDTGLEGPVSVSDWWPDASALLLHHTFEGRHHLYRYDLASGALSPVSHPNGQISSARIRPDGRVWFRHTSGAEPPRILDDEGAEVLVPDGDRAPAGRPYVSWHFRNARGQTVHGFYATPEGEGPFPVLVHPHGGPTWLDEDRWSPEVQSYLDVGFAVALVNYRGSTGYGAAWRDSLVGDIGGPELEDLNAGLADLIAREIADPERAAVGGWSWGGYLTLMELGKHPELWKAGVAGVPVGDYEMSYDDMSPILQAYDRALLGGRPRGRSRSDGGSEPHLLRRPRRRARPVHHRRERQPLPAASGARVRRGAQEARPPARGLPLRHGAFVVRHRRGRAAAAHDPRVLAPQRPGGVRRGLDVLAEGGPWGGAFGGPRAYARCSRGYARPGGVPGGAR